MLIGAQFSSAIAARAGHQPADLAVQKGCPADSEASRPKKARVDELRRAMSPPL